MTSYNDAGFEGSASSSPAPRSAALTRAAPLEAPVASGAARWVCVKHRAWRGKEAKFAIRSAGFECHLPLLVVSHYRKPDTLDPLFPGYVLVRIDPGQSWGPLALVSDVLEIMRAHGTTQPAYFPIGLVEGLIERAGAIDLPIDEQARQPWRLRPGPVVIQGGPLDAFKGMLVADRGGERVDVLMDMLGVKRTVQVSRKLVASA